MGGVDVTPRGGFFWTVLALSGLLYACTEPGEEEPTPTEAPGDDDESPGEPDETPEESPTPEETATPEPEPTPEGPTPIPLCVDAPVLTWNNFGQGFLIENCQTCHASTSPNRYGAPAGVTFDTRDQALQWEDRILARATGEAPSMPPGGGVSEDDRYRLEVWLTCWE